MRHVGSVRQQLFMDRELIAQLDLAQESRTLTDTEREFRAELKGRCLGLASLARTMARYRSRVRFLRGRCQYIIFSSPGLPPQT